MRGDPHQGQQAARQRRETDAAQHARRITVAQAPRNGRHHGHEYGPRRHQKTRLDGRAAQRDFKIERQGDERQPLRGKRAHGRQRGQQKQGAAEQVDGQHGRHVPRLAAQQQDKEHCHGHQFRQQDGAGRVMGNITKQQNEQAEGAHVVQRRTRIERVP